MTTTRVTDIGAVISQDILAQIGVRAGDDLQVVAADGCISLKKCDGNAQEQIDVAKRIMEERRDVLRRLAE